MKRVDRISCYDIVENFQLVNSASVRCIPVVHAQCEVVGLARYGKYVWEPGGFELQCSIDVNLECIGVVAIHSYDKVCPFGLWNRSEEHTSELQSREKLVCRLLLEKERGSA